MTCSAVTIVTPWMLFGANGFCSADKEGESCAGVIEKEFGAEIRGIRADLDEKAEGVCPICGKKNSVVVYAGKSY